MPRPAAGRYRTSAERRARFRWVPYDAYSETGTKIAGPIPGLFADKMVKGLASLLERLGHAVVIEDTADD
jgi:hypothetical protein